MSEISIKTVCCTCLSDNRQLRQLCRIMDGINLLYMLLSQDPDAYKEGFHTEVASLLVCWECAAVISRIKRFRTQACIAQKHLTSVEERRNNAKIQSLSHLTVINNKTLHYEYQSSLLDSENFVDCGPILEEIKPEYDSDDTPLFIFCHENDSNDYNTTELTYDTDSQKVTEDCGKLTKNSFIQFDDRNKDFDNDILSQNRNILCNTDIEPENSKIQDNNKKKSPTNKIQLRKSKIQLIKSKIQPENSTIDIGNCDELSRDITIQDSSGILAKDVTIQLRKSKIQLIKSKIQPENSTIDIGNCDELSRDITIQDSSGIPAKDVTIQLRKSKIQLINDKIQPENTTINIDNCDELSRDITIQDNSGILAKDVTIQLDNSNLQLDNSNIQLKNSTIHTKNSNMTTNGKPRMKLSKYFTIVTMNEDELWESVEKRKIDIENDAIKCDKCILGFKNEDELLKHNERHIKKDNLNKCDICHSYIEDLPTHRQSHYHVYICVLCLHRTHTHTDIVGHLETNHYELCWRRKKKSKKKCRVSLEDRKYPCPECDLNFQNKDRRWKHVQKVHREGFECTTCHKKFSLKNNLERHERIHGAPLPRQECPTCHKLVRVDLFAAHSRTHAHRQAHTCVECDKHFVSLHTYNTHLKYARAHAGAAVASHKCSMCEKRYRSRGELRDHVNYHHKGLADHKCPVCGKGLATKRCVRRHVRRSHDGIPETARDKICQQCGKTFRDKKSLIEHERVHTGARPLSCGECGRAFRQRAALHRHATRLHASTA